MKDKKVIKSAFLMTLGTLISRILGFLRDYLFFTLYPRYITDAFVVALRIPSFFRRFLGEGALSVSFIPTYLEARGDKEAQKQLATVLWTALFIISLLVCGLSFIYIEPILQLIAGGAEFWGSPQKVDLAIKYGRITVLYLFFVVQFAYFMALLNAWDEFFIPGLAPALFNLIFILFILLGFLPWPVEGINLALGVLAGGLFQALMVFYKAYLLKFRISFNFNFKHPLFRKVLSKTLPSMIGLGIWQILSLVNNRLASSLEEGTLSNLFIGERLIELPQSLIAVSLGAALLPSLSKLKDIDKAEEFKETLFQGFRYFSLLAVPSAIGLYFYHYEIISLLFNYGKVTEKDIMQTSMVVKYYSSILLLTGFIKILSPSLYALQKNWLPGIASLIAILGHIVYAPILLNKFGLSGLLLSTMITMVLACVYLNGFLILNVGHVFTWSRVKNLAPQLKLHIVMLILCLGMSRLGLSKEYNLIVIFEVLTVICAFVTLGFLLKVPEIRIVISPVLKKLGLNFK